MHGSDALQRQIVVHHGEHALLHLAAVPGVDDAGLPAGDVEHGRRLGVQAQLLVVGDLALGGVVHHEVRLEIGQFLLGGPDEHILHEVGLPGHLHDEAHGHAGIVVGAAEAVHHIELLAGQLLQGDLLHGLPGLHRGGVVVVFVLRAGPPHGILGVLVHNDELVVGGAAGIDAGHHVHRPQLAELALVIAGEAGVQLVPVQVLIGGVVHDLGGPGDAVSAQIDLGHNISTSHL